MQKWKDESHKNYIITSQRAGILGNAEGLVRGEGWGVGREYPTPPSGQGFGEEARPSAEKNRLKWRFSEF